MNVLSADFCIYDIECSFTVQVRRYEGQLWGPNTGWLTGKTKRGSMSLHSRPVSVLSCCDTEKAGASNASKS